jgi:hypothetical protein
MNRRLLFPLAGALAAIPAKASACAVCMGDPNSYVADATNSTIWMLLGLVALMFIATGLTAFFIWRHARTPIPPHLQFVESLTNEPEEC